MPERGGIVIDRDGTLRYAQIVPEIPREPEYDAVIQAVRDLV